MGRWAYARGVRGSLESHHVFARAWRRRGEVTTADVVTRHLLNRHLRLAQFLEPLLGTVTALGLTLDQQLLLHFLITRETLRLADLPLVIFETEPGHPLENGIDGFSSGTLEVGVLDPQNKGAAVLTGVYPGKERGAGAADMQIARGAGSEASANRHDEISGSVGRLRGCVFYQGLADADRRI